MSLPVQPLPTGSVVIGETVVEYRSLSRTAALKVSTEFHGKPHEAEVFILSKGVGCTLDEAEEWLDSTDPEKAGDLIDAIIFFSGLAKPPPEVPDDDPD